MRKYRVHGPDDMKDYRGFDRNESGAKFALRPVGFSPDIEGDFFCGSIQELRVAVPEVLRYLFDEYAHCEGVTVIEIPGGMHEVTSDGNVQ